MTVNKDDHDGFPVYMLGITVDEGAANGFDLIYHTVRTRLARVDGVASVEINGLIEKEILIELDREKAAAAGLNLWELGQELSGDNFTLASGSVREGSRKLLLRSIARYDDLEALENRLVAPSVRLKDVAAVKYQEPERDFQVRAMGKPAVALMVLKEGQANVMEVSRAVDKEVDRLEADPRLSSLAWLRMMNQGKIINEALATLLNSGMIGGSIALIVLLFFLRRIRLTVILALAIPLSMLIGLTTMYFAGESLNLLTLLGLMICVGLLVDNSVVVAENIHRMHRGGMGRRESCIHGAGEVALAITMSTLTTIVRVPAGRAGRRPGPVFPDAAGLARVCLGRGLVARGAGVRSALRLSDTSDAGRVPRARPLATRPRRCRGRAAKRIRPDLRGG